MKPQILSELYKPVLASIKERNISTFTADLIEYDIKEGQDPLFGAEGMIFVFATKKGTGISNLVKKATQDVAAAQELKDLIHGQSANDPRTDVETAVKLVEKADVIAELRLGTEILLQTIYIPDGITLYVSTFIYNGGPLPEDGFLVIERTKEGATDGLEVVILKINPVLNDLEKAALSQVPKSQWVQNLGRPAEGCGDSYTALATLVLATAACVAVACLFVPPIDKLSTHELNTLNPSSSARKLLQFREKAIANATHKN